MAQNPTFPDISAICDKLNETGALLLVGGACYLTSDLSSCGAVTGSIVAGAALLSIGSHCI